MRQIIAIGGGDFAPEPSPYSLDAYVLRATGKPTPKICFLPHATSEAFHFATRFYDTFAKLNCTASWLDPFWPQVRDVGAFFLEQDAIYVGGGNTKTMLAIWREWGWDKALRAAYERGVVLAGLSAGANCWFEACSTDSFGNGTLRPLACLGFLAGAFCPHYDAEPERRPTLHAMVANGELPDALACDDGVAGHFVDDQFARAVSSRPNAKAYRVARDEHGVSEIALDTHFLGA